MTDSGPRWCALILSFMIKIIKEGSQDETQMGDAWRLMISFSMGWDFAAGAVTAAVMEAGRRLWRNC